MLRRLPFLILALFALSACAQTNQQFYPAQGVVIKVNPTKSTVTIKHGDIPGYMDAMIMAFDVKDTNELTGLAAGDVVTFRIVDEKNDAWIDQIHQTGAKTNTPPTTGPFRAVREVQPLNEGDLLPEYHLTNQLGKAISTAQFKGQALAITFLFTRCPYPNFCPLMANNFSETSQELLANPLAPRNWHLLTITFDPEHDTPEVLRDYAKAHHADGAHSTFATGDLMEITALGEQFGLAFWKEQGSIINHNLRTIVIDPAGRVQKVFNGNTWQPADLTAELTKAAKIEP